MDSACNLERIYDEVTRTIIGFFNYYDVIYYRFLADRYPLNLILIAKEFINRWPIISVLATGNSKFNIRIANEYGTVEEKENIYFAVATDEYPTHQLSLLLQQKFPDVDFNTMVRVHELKKNGIENLDLKAVIGAALTMITILFKTIPENIVSMVFNVEDYEKGVSALTILVLVYLFIVLPPLWFKTHQTKVTHQSLGAILSYTAARLSQATGNIGI